MPGVHLAFGDPYGSQTGAPWKSRTHVDVLTRDCDVWIDDEQVIRRGRYLLERLGLVTECRRGETHSVVFPHRSAAKWASSSTATTARR